MKAWKIHFRWNGPSGGMKEYEIMVFSSTRRKARRGLLGRCGGARITRVVRDFNADGAASDWGLVADERGRE